MFNNKTVKNEIKKTKEKKISFIRKFIISIKDFDKYTIFLNEGFKKTLLYLIKIIAMFSVVVALLSVYDYAKKMNSIAKAFDEKIQTVSYENEKLSINKNEKLEEDDFLNLLGKIIIDTSDLTDEQINDYKESLKGQSKAILFLNDKIILKYPTKQELVENKYVDIFKDLKNIQISKYELVKYYNENLPSIYLAIAFSGFTAIFITYIVNVLWYCIILAILGYIIALILRIKMQLLSTFSIAAHSLTLPMVLNLIYVIFNSFTGYTIKYFNIMYMAIAFIYVITVIFMIKSDFMKQQVEVGKIEDEQQRIREELQEKEQERKNKEEKEREKNKPDDSEKKKSNDENKTAPQVGNKPEGDNA